MSQRNHRKLSSSFRESRDSLLSGNCDGRGSRGGQRSREREQIFSLESSRRRVTWADEVPPVVSPLRRAQMFLWPLRKSCRELMKSSAVDKICPSVRPPVVVMRSRRCTCLSSASSRWLENLPPLYFSCSFMHRGTKCLVSKDSGVFLTFYISHKSRLQVEDASRPAGLHVDVRRNNLKI